jgi:hypothetical protein
MGQIKTKPKYWDDFEDKFMQNLLLKKRKVAKQLAFQVKTLVPNYSVKNTIKIREQNILDLGEKVNIIDTPKRDRLNHIVFHAYYKSTGYPLRDLRIAGWPIEIYRSSSMLQENALFNDVTNTVGELAVEHLAPVKSDIFVRTRFYDDDNSTLYTMEIDSLYIEGASMEVILELEIEP